MNKKFNLIILGLILMIGLVSANRSLNNVIGINIQDNVIGGSTVEANFSFDYVHGRDNIDGSPLIIKLNITSENEEYPIWKGDFKINGRIEKSMLFGLWIKTVEFECSEDEEQTIEHPLDAQNVTAPDGIFYCYNEKGDLDLNEHNKIYLEVSFNKALYPGKYNFTAELFYLTDERAPFVNITNKNMFEQYYREVDNILVKATIFDGSEIQEKWVNVTLSGFEIFLIGYDHFENEEYYFSRNTPSDIIEDDYNLTVFASDIFDNTGSDTTKLKIDRTAPIITLNKSIGIIGEVMNLTVNVVDKKAGVDNSSVKYRLREMFGYSPCPESGVGTFTCYNSGWIILPNVGDDLFGKEINTSELNGDFWLEVRASDILGNSGEL